MATWTRPTRAKLGGWCWCTYVRAYGCKRFSSLFCYGLEDPVPDPYSYSKSSGGVATRRGSIPHSLGKKFSDSEATSSSKSLNPPLLQAPIDPYGMNACVPASVLHVFPADHACSIPPSLPPFLPHNFKLHPSAGRVQRMNRVRQRDLHRKWSGFASGEKHALAHASLCGRVVTLVR